MQAAIEVKNAFEITDRSGEVKRRAGCVFVKPDNRTIMMLQRYVALAQQRLADSKA